MRTILFCALLLWSSLASAATYYISDCQPGADVNCVPGSNASLTPTNPATPYQTYAGVTAAQRTGGNKFLFARGGKWVDAKWTTPGFTGSVSKCNPTLTCEWGSYTPSWCTGPCLTQRPWLVDARAGTIMFNTDDGGAILKNTGYIIRGLKLDGGGVASFGIFIYRWTDDMIIEDNEITGFSPGIHSSHNPECESPQGTPCAGRWTNSNIIVRNNYIHDNRGAGWLGGVFNLVMENNVFDRNGTATFLDHNIYLSNVVNGVIRGNVLTASAVNGSNQCLGTSLVAHGINKNVLVERNTIIETGTSIATCFGIEFDQGYADGAVGLYGERNLDIVIRDNLIVNVGAMGIGVRSCQRCLIENNRIVWPGSGGTWGISAVGGNAPAGTDFLNNQITIRNNSIYYNSPNAGQGIVFPNEGTGHVVTNNLILFGTSSSTLSKCFQLNGTPLSSFTAFNNNLCFRAGTLPVYSDVSSTLGAAQALGWDVNGLAVDPLFVALPDVGNGYSFVLQSGSPAKDAGHATHKARLSCNGLVPIGARDIGACDVGASVAAPASPTLIRRN